jgi:hypothetical protein
MWTTMAWQHISPIVTVTGFRKCCISNAVDESDDNMLRIVRSECEEDEGTNCEDGDSDTDC